MKGGVMRGLPVVLFLPQMVFRTDMATKYKCVNVNTRQNNQKKKS